ncbi:MAG: hypothetical protein JNK40_10235 [Chromatiales bacterium]|nr:hypothetical protein [Chromatiales bacterium]
MAEVTLGFRGAAGLASVALVLAACGGGGGGGGGSAPAAPAVITAGNAATITREVLDVGLGAGAFGAAIGGGSILSADGAANATVLGMARQRQSIQQVRPSMTIPAETFDCLVSGTVRLSGSVASTETLTAGDRINATFNSCDDAEGAILDGGLRIDVTTFSGDVFSGQYLLGANVTVTNLGITEDGTTATGDGSFALDLDLRVPLVSDLTISGAYLRVAAGSDDWVLRDFAVTVVEDGRGVSLLTRYSGTGTLEGAGFEGAVDFVTVEPLVATGDEYPATGEVLIEGAGGATIRATAISAETIQLAIDLDGNDVVDETQQMPWSTVGPLGAVLHMASPGPVPLP